MATPARRNRDANRNRKRSFAAGRTGAGGPALGPGENHAGPHAGRPVAENQQPAIIVTPEIAPEEAVLGSVVADIREGMSGMIRSGELPPGSRWETGGRYLRQQEALRSLAAVMAVAILLVFIRLAFQFQSVALPLSLVSGLFALWLTNTPLNVSIYMGSVLLIGLNVKNGILLVE